MNETSAIISYQQKMIKAKTDTDVFASLLQTWALHSDRFFATTIVFLEDETHTIVGRYGIPTPDSYEFCQLLTNPIVNIAKQNPQTQQIDATDHINIFNKRIHRYLPGITIFIIPLKPELNKLVGIAILYRKGEQPFTKLDYKLADLLAHPTALAVERI